MQPHQGQVTPKKIESKDDVSFDVLPTWYSTWLKSMKSSILLFYLLCQINFSSMNFSGCEQVVRASALHLSEPCGALPAPRGSSR